MADLGNELEKLRNRLDEIEIRVRGLESTMKVVETGEQIPFIQSLPEDDLPVNSDLINEGGRGLESQIGRFGLAWMGNIVLLFGISFLTQYMIITGNQILSVVLGYGASISIFVLSEYLKKANSYLAFMFRINAQLLVFYVTLRLHFYSTDPLIGKTTTTILMLFLVGLQFYLSLRNKSQAFAALSVLFALITAILSDSTHFMLLMVIVTAASSVYYFYRFNWHAVLLTTVFLSYICFTLWLFSNPLAGHPFEMLNGKFSGIVYLFTLGAIFSGVLVFRKTEESSDDLFIGVTFVNGVLFSLLLILIVLRFYTAGYVQVFAVITGCCLLYSGFLHKNSNWNFATAFYALYGYMAMSIAFYGLVGLPSVYWLLSFQSLVVVSMGLWFRNKLIVIMNSLLFLTILFIYIASSNHVNAVNFSFALTALVSARIVNWQKSRLQIKTDFLRNMYMVEGFFMMLYALYNSVPGHFIALSWTMAALLYFLLSILLKNVKYRYMALGTMISAALYLFIVDLARIELVYRILALLFLAAISIGISIYYTNRMKKAD